MYDQKETETGYMYYVNKKTGERQNDNPKLLEIMKIVREQHKTIKYITYRSATKIWFLKQSFYTVNIPFSFVISVLNHYGINQSDSVPTLKPDQLTSILHDVYFAAEKCGHFTNCDDFNLDRCTAVLANFFWCIYDPNRVVALSLLEFKQAMLILCNTQHFDQLITDEFNIAADHNRCVNRFRFESVVKVISKFFAHLDENPFYRSQMIGDSVHECFEQCPGMIGLNEFQFASLWQNQNIQFAHYSNVLALVYRIKESQNVVHEACCIACKQSPIIGIRFKCQQCRKFSLCFECFCTGYKDSKHELSHRMYEISTNQIKSNAFCTFIRNVLCCCSDTKDRPDKSSNGNMTMETKIAGDEHFVNGTATIDCINDTRFSSIRDSRQLRDQTVNTTILIDDKQAPSERMDILIDSLMHQAEQLQDFLNLTKARKRDKLKFLMEHQIFLTEVIEKLRALNPSKSSTASFPHSSTPYRNTNSQQSRVLSIGSRIGSSVHGAEINRSFLEDNRSDWSLGDISTWLHLKSHSNINTTVSDLQPITEAIEKPGVDLFENGFESEMQNFKELLNKIREIMDDSYSDNTELSTAARKLETALDNIIGAEEQKRTYL